MNRRNFLKRCSLIPFGLVAGASEGLMVKQKKHIGDRYTDMFYKTWQKPGMCATEVTEREWERSRNFLEDTIFNGQVFEAPWPLCHTVIVQYFTNDKWILLSSPYESVQHKGNAMMVCYYKREDGSENPFYTQKQLQEKLKDWKLVNEFVRLIDYRSIVKFDN